jgi:hypothetical protein|nr:hypothetical protein [Pseudomonadales bacterium]
MSADNRPGLIGMLLCLAGLHNRKPKPIVIWRTSCLTAILEPDVCTRCGSMRRGDRVTLSECRDMVKKETEQ